MVALWLKYLPLFTNMVGTIPSHIFPVFHFYWYVQETHSSMVQLVGSSELRPLAQKRNGIYDVKRIFCMETRMLFYNWKQNLR